MAAPVRVEGARNRLPAVCVGCRGAAVCRSRLRIQLSHPAPVPLADVPPHATGTRRLPFLGGSGPVLTPSYFGVQDGALGAGRRGGPSLGR